MSSAGELRMPEWAGSGGFRSAWKLAAAIPQGPPDATDDETHVGAAMLGILNAAHPIVCPPSQLAAVEDPFPSTAAAFEYAKAIRLPFPHLFIDFTPPAGETFPSLEITTPSEEQDHRELWKSTELRGIAISENVEQQHLSFVPVIGAPGELPEEVGMVELFRDEQPMPDAESGYFVAPMETPVGKIEVRFFTVSAIEEMLGESQTRTHGGIVGAHRATSKGDPLANSRLLAATTAICFRLALRVLYLLDTINIELVDVELTRQERRLAERKHHGKAVRISITRRSTSSAKAESETTEFSHQFEVRGNFAHYGPETQLFRRSEPTDLKPCPRCGTCRRVWRSPHIKGPTDKPLVVKVRHFPASSVPPN